MAPAEVHDFAPDRKCALPLTWRSRVRGREHSKRMPALRPCQLQAGARIDDLPRVNRRPHRRIAAGSGNVEQAHPFHEERALFAEEDRKTLVHLDFKRVAFDLTEIRVDRRIECDRRRQAVLHADADVSPCPRRIPPRAIGSDLIARERRTRDHLEQAPRLQLVERDDGIRLEHPLAGRHLRPRRRHARAAQPPPEQHAHAHVRPAAKADVLERDADLRRPAVGADVPCALPHPVGREIFAARSALQRVHLDAAGVDEEMIGKLPRAARVEADADPIVSECVVAAGDVRSNFVRLRCPGSGTRSTRLLRRIRSRHGSSPRRLRPASGCTTSTCPVAADRPTTLRRPGCRRSLAVSRCGRAGGRPCPRPAPGGERAWRREPGQLRQKWPLSRT